MFFIVLILVCTPAATHGWSDYGHAMIGTVIAKTLAPETLQFYESKLASWNDDINTLPMACMWSDWIKPSPSDISKRPDRLKLFDSWHYIVLPASPFRDVDIPHDLASQQRNSGALWALQQVYLGLNNLKGDEGSAFSWNIQLRMLLHIVGDIHQPLHTSTFYSKDLPKGDCGGNKWKMEEGGSLHSFWDKCAGECASPYPFSMTEMSSRASSWMAQYPLKFFENKFGSHYGLTNFRDITAESHNIAEAVAYQVLEATNFNSHKKVIMNDKYQQFVKEMCKERVVLAGYRLSTMLDRLYRQNIDSTDLTVAGRRKQVKPALRRKLIV